MSWNFNVNNSTRSRNRTRTKWDTNQETTGRFGDAHCRQCDEVFTKPTAVSKYCSDECRKLWYREYYRKRDAKRMEDPEYVEMRRKQHRELKAKERKENPEAVRRREREYYATEKGGANKRASVKRYMKKVRESETKLEAHRKYQREYQREWRRKK